MTEIVLTHKGDERFLSLIKLLDEELYEIYGDIQKSYEKHNKIETVEHVALAVVNGRAVGCGGYKMYDSKSAEIKRVYVSPEYRNCGLAAKIMQCLHDKARECGYIKCVLETGEQQKSAMRLYERLGYVRTQNYGVYAHMQESICLEKCLLY